MWRSSTSLARWGWQPGELRTVCSSVLTATVFLHSALQRSAGTVAKMIPPWLLRAPESQTEVGTHLESNNCMHSIMSCCWPPPKAAGSCRVTWNSKSRGARTSKASSPRVSFAFICCSVAHVELHNTPCCGPFSTSALKGPQCRIICKEAFSQQVSPTFLKPVNGC